MDIAKYTEQFEKRLRKQTDKYMGLSVAISGGIDSGTLAALLQPAFVISVDLPGGDKYHEGKFARKVVKHVGLKHVVVKPNRKEFQEGMRAAVKAIGRPIPHFNIFPLWSMYKKLHSMGIKELILGDGPDETLCGYTRNLVMAYLYRVYDFQAFERYGELIGKVLGDPAEVYSRMIGKDHKTVAGLMKRKDLVKGMNIVDMELMRPDMDDMSNKIAESFGIKNIRPYQDDARFDKWQYNLPREAKIYMDSYGKFILRSVASKYLPFEIAWRPHKVGGPVYPVNKIMAWDRKDGEFGKESYLKYQERILNG